ncbi:hypothetical protein RUND412_009081 [Rhizina undulata]
MFTLLLLMVINAFINTVLLFIIATAVAIIAYPLCVRPLHDTTLPRRRRDGSDYCGPGFDFEVPREVKIVSYSFVREVGAVTTTSQTLPEVTDVAGDDKIGRRQVNVIGTFTVTGTLPPNQIPSEIVPQLPEPTSTAVATSESTIAPPAETTVVPTPETTPVLQPPPQQTEIPATTVSSVGDGMTTSIPIVTTAGPVVTSGGNNGGNGLIPAPTASDALQSPTSNPTSTSSNTLSAGTIAGVGITGFFFIVAVVFTVHWFHNKYEWRQIKRKLNMKQEDKYSNAITRPIVAVMPKPRKPKGRDTKAPAKAPAPRNRSRAGSQNRAETRSRNRIETDDSFEDVDLSGDNFNRESWTNNDPARDNYEATHDRFGFQILPERLMPALMRGQLIRPRNSPEEPEPDDGGTGLPPDGEISRAVSSVFSEGAFFRSRDKRETVMSEGSGAGIDVEREALDERNVRVELEMKEMEQRVREIMRD